VKSADSQKINQTVFRNISTFQEIITRQMLNLIKLYNFNFNHQLEVYIILSEVYYYIY